MNLKFKKFGGVYIDDLGEYAREYIKEHKHSNVKIYVGTDSNPKNFHFATVVVFYHERNGAHFVFSEEYLKPIKDRYTRLWTEVYRSFEVGEYLEKELNGVYTRLEHNKKLVDIDLDLNPNERWGSNSVFNDGIGFIASAGYRVRGKPLAWAASCAADLICRNGARKKKKKKNNNKKKKK